MFCTNCGTELTDDKKFCTNCGTPVIKNAPVSAPAQTPDESIIPETVQPAEAEVAEAIPVVEEIPAEPEMAVEPEVPDDLPDEVLVEAEEPVTEYPSVPVIAPAAPVPPVPRKRKKRKKRPFGGCLIALAIGVIIVSLLAGLLAAPLLLLLGGAYEQSSDSPPASSTPLPSIPPVDEKVELVVNPAELVYEMTDADVDEFYALLEQLEESALSGADGDTVMELSEQVDDQYYYLDAQLTIAMVLYYQDLNDEAASELYLNCNETITQAYNDYMEMAKELYDAEFPAKDRFFEEWSDQEIAMLMAYTPEVMDLEQRNSEIEVAYQDLQDDADMYTEMVPLYIEMVQNNNRIANIYGYDNYYEYAYALSYNRDYDISEIKTMRKYTAKYLPEAIENALYNLQFSMMNQSWDALEGFMYGTYTPEYQDEIADYFATLPEQARNDMLDMFDGNIIMADNLPNAQEGAFTTTVGDDRCICFYGPGYSNPLTMIHEVGHYYGASHTPLNEIPLDLAETQSQGNEWLFMGFMSSKMDADFYNAVVGYKTYNDLATIVLCVIIDEFEERVYTHPDIENLTSDDLDAIMEDVCENYGGIDFLSNNVADVQNYWRMVVVEQPVYYISYGVSAIAAINVYTIALEDYQLAVQIYCNLNENVVVEDGFLGNIKNAGLNGPFDEEVYQKLYEMTA